MQPSNPAYTLAGGAMMAVIGEIVAEKPPLSVWEDGSVRIGDSRLLLELVIHSFNAGNAPERIAEQFPPVSVGDLYSVIGYYLRHKDRFDRYFAECEVETDELRARIERMFPPDGL